MAIFARSHNYVPMAFLWPSLSSRSSYSAEDIFHKAASLSGLRNIISDSIRLGRLAKTAHLTSVPPSCSLKRVVIPIHWSLSQIPLVWHYPYHNADLQISSPRSAAFSQVVPCLLFLLFWCDSDIKMYIFDVIDYSLYTMRIVCGSVVARWNGAQQIERSSLHQGHD